MKAVVYDKYGPPEVLRLAEVEQQVETGQKTGNVVLTVSGDPGT